MSCFEVFVPKTPGSNLRRGHFGQLRWKSPKILCWRECAALKSYFVLSLENSWYEASAMLRVQIPISQRRRSSYPKWISGYPPSHPIPFVVFAAPIEARMQRRACRYRPCLRLCSQFPTFIRTGFEVTTVGGIRGTVAMAEISTAETENAAERLNIR